MQQQTQQQAREQAAAEADARRELQRELERLRRTGRLDGGVRSSEAAAAKPASGPAPMPQAAASSRAAHGIAAGPAWTHAERLPPHWQQQKAPDGKIYFYHRITEQTQWERPRAEAAETVSAAELERLEQLTMTRLEKAIERQQAGVQLGSTAAGT